MEKNTTRSLSKVLEKMKSSRDAEQFISKNASKNPKTFSTYLNEFIGMERISLTYIIKESCVNSNYFYNILNGHVKKPGRDKIIAICIGAGMSYSQIQRGLELAFVRPLYPKDQRDIRISVAVNQGISNVKDINKILVENNLEPLDV